MQIELPPFSPRFIASSRPSHRLRLSDSWFQSSKDLRIPISSTHFELRIGNVKLHYLDLKSRSINMGNRTILLISALEVCDEG